MVIEAVARLIVSNNAKLSGDIKQNVLQDAKLPPVPVIDLGWLGVSPKEPSVGTASDSGIWLIQFVG